MMWVAILASLLLAVGGLAAFWWASTIKRPAADPGANAIRVTIHDDVCDPNDITVPAGRTTFVIANASRRILEWEILDGVMVVEERENIAPGFSQTINARLQPGKYEITCGLLSNPRGTLTVTPSAESDAEAARPSLVAYIGPLAEYRVTLLTQAATLQKALQALDAAIKAGNLEQARDAYLQAHQAYARMEPISDLISDLDARLNVRPEYLEKREDDSAFVGNGFVRVDCPLCQVQGNRFLPFVRGSGFTDGGQRLRLCHGNQADSFRLTGRFQDVRFLARLGGEYLFRLGCFRIQHARLLLPFGGGDGRDLDAFGGQDCRALLPLGGHLFFHILFD